MELPVKNSKVTGSKKLKQLTSKSETGVLLSPEKTSKTSYESSLTRLAHTDLAKFCPKKLFYIIFANEIDKDSAVLLDKFAEVSYSYEIVSSVTFITREDVLDLLDTNKYYLFPNQLKPLLLDVIESAKAFDLNDMPSIYEAQLVKLKLIQVMYQQYVTQVKQNQKEKNLEDLLNYLTKECKKKQKKDETGQTGISSPEKNKSPTREDAKKKNKKDDKGMKDETKDEEIDYTTIPLDNDGISFEENIFNYVWFYCIKGFYNIEVLQHLTQQLNCPLCAIIKINTESNNNTMDIPDHIHAFWKNINLHFVGNTTPYDFLEDSMLMQFTPLNKCIEENVLELLQQFVFVLRRILDIKLTHLKYLRYLKIYRIQNVYAVMPLDCMQIYNRSLQYFPLECINSPVILDALLKEVCYHLDLKPVSRTASTRSLTLSKGSVKSFPPLRCVDPLHDFQAFGKIKKKISVKQDANGFLTHDHNSLLKVLKFYKNVGPKIFDISLNFMKQFPIFENVLLKGEDITGDVPHTHDIDPSTKFEVKDEETVDNFLYLFLFKTFSNKADVPSTTKKYNLVKNLVTFDLPSFWTEVQTKCYPENTTNKVNWYDTPLVHFRWKEKLYSDVMIQEILDAASNFLYYDQKYSPETDNFLVVFSNKLDAFGLNTKIFEECVRTPVSLRDFCRYTTVEEAEWLQKHETEIIKEDTFKIELNEVCSGVHKVKTQMKLFHEYSYLLDGNIKEEVEDSKISYNPQDEEIILEESQDADINFNDVLMDLQRYPSHKNLNQECGKAAEPQQLLSYDLGSHVFKITGHVTTFCSHDGVKVTVDNTRFLQKPEKCSVTVTSNENILTLYSSRDLIEEPYVLSLLLKDGSRISFVVKKEERHSVSKKGVNLEEISEENEAEIKNIVYEHPKEQNDNEEPVESKVDQVVHCIDEHFFKELFGNDLDYFPINEDHEELLEAILNARENNNIIYKINAPTNHLKRLNRELKVPIEHALKNIFPRDTLVHNRPKHYKTYTKRFESTNEDKSDLEVINSVDFRICLPNGLFIKAHPCTIDKKILLIKQEYTEGKPNFETVQHEEFRLFSYQGFICIKKIDGTITILKGNGDIIDFEKPTDGSGEDNSFRPCHCANISDYRNKLNKMLKEKNVSDYFASRRGHITHKQNYVLDKKLLNLLENFDVPYLKKSITRFDGKKIAIQGNKITQKQLYHMTSQQDFITEKIFFERSDDFRSTFDGNGSQKIIFPDGTLISNSVYMSDELVDDFVYVTISFQYEHPNYATITYDFDKTLKIMLNNDVVVKKKLDAECFTVNMQKNILVSVSKENVSFQKACDDCSGTFQCNFNIEPFHGETWTPSEEFLHVQDTYGKHFYSDFVGNCYRKPDYVEGRLNSFNCNHYKKCNNYRKLFVINKDLSGEMFCTDNMVQNKIMEMSSAPDSSSTRYNISPDNQAKVVDCRQKKYIRFCDRFYNNADHFNQNSQKKELYSTFRVFHPMFKSVIEIDTHILKLREAYFCEYFDSCGNEMIFKNIALLITDVQIYNKAFEVVMFAEQEDLERKKMDREAEENRKKNAICPCVKQRISMADKIANWKKTCTEYKKKLRSRRVPVYFKSDFCKIVE